MVILQGDCLELMDGLPEGCADMVLSDLPYGTTRNKWDTPLDLGRFWKSINRVTKPEAAIVLHCAQPFTSVLIMSNLKRFKYCWVWDKHYCRGFLNAKRQPLRNHEEIAVFYRRQCKYHPQMTKGIYRAKGNSAKQRGCYGQYKPVKIKNDVYYPKSIISFAGVPVPELKHPTQKPVELLEYLIRTYTDPGDLVLDCCMGSGSTGIAAMNTGRDFIGMELDSDYYEQARQRLEAWEDKKWLLEGEKIR